LALVSSVIVPSTMGEDQLETAAQTTGLLLDEFEHDAEDAVLVFEVGVVIAQLLV